MVGLFFLGVVVIVVLCVKSAITTLFYEIAGEMHGRRSL